MSIVLRKIDSAVMVSIDTIWGNASFAEYPDFYIGVMLFGGDVDGEIVEMVDQLLKVFRLDLRQRERDAVPA